MNTNEQQIMDGQKSNYYMPADSSVLYPVARIRFSILKNYTLINFLNFTEFQ